MEVLRNIKIEEGTVRIDGAVDFAYADKGFNLFVKQAYKHYLIDYSKFFKMSQMCKLGFLASELLLKGINLSEVESEMVSIILANSSSSLHSDKVYQGTIESLPSPSSFVYTLPNILIGEICIRHGIKGEGTFFIQDHFEKDFIFDYVLSLFKARKSTISIAGWVDIDMDGSYIADLYLLKSK
jgi:hypothetical protein